MTKEEIVENLKLFFYKYIGDRHIDLDLKIFSSGLINSLFAMQYVMYIEKEFKVAIENEDLDLKNFATLNLTSDFLLTKINGIS